MVEKEKRAKVRVKPITKILWCLIIVAILLGGYIVWNNFIKPKSNKAKVVDSIKNKDVDYVVNDSDTKIFKQNFNELKKVLNAKDVDNEKYAEVITKLFVIDFFTLSKHGQTIKSNEINGELLEQAAGAGLIKELGTGGKVTTYEMMKIT